MTREFVNHCSSDSNSSGAEKKVCVTLKKSQSTSSYSAELTKADKFRGLEEMMLSGALLKVFRCPGVVERSFVAKVILTSFPLQVIHFSAHNVSDSLPWMGTLTLPDPLSFNITNEIRMSLTLVVGHGGVGLKTFFLPLTFPEVIDSQRLIYRQKFYIRERLVHGIQLSISKSSPQKVCLHSKLRILFSPTNATAVALEPNDSRCETQLIPLPHFNQPNCNAIVIKR